MTSIVRRKKKLLYLGGLGGSLRCCCECCVYDGDCVKRRYIPDGACENPYEFDRFKGTITVEWCGISYTFNPDDRPGQYNFAIGPLEPRSTGNECDCGTIFFTGQTRPRKYKDELAQLFILGGPSSPPDDASADCLRIFVPIHTSLRGALNVVYEDESTYAYDYALSGEYFVFTQDQCRRNKLVRLPGFGNICHDKPEHMFCRVDPVVTVNEAE